MAAPPARHRRAFINGCWPISASSAPAWSGSALAAGSRPRWRRWRRANSTGSSWSARWASSRPRATSSTRRSSAISTTPAPAFTTRTAFARIYGEVSTDQLVAWDLCREMCFRIAWKPYMYSQTLPHLLGGVRAPALVVWGDDDKIVPRSAGELYAALAARGAVRDRARFRALRRDGAAGGAGPARHAVHRAELNEAAGRDLGQGGSHACDVFHRAADVGLSGRYRARSRPYRADVLEQAFRSGRRQPAL